MALVVLFLLPAACGGSPDDAVERGDRLYGAGQVNAAIAEYRLALRQRGDEPEVLLRLGDAYGKRGEVEAGLRYVRRLLAQDSTYRYQAAAVLSSAARVALEGRGTTPGYRITDAPSRCTWRRRKAIRFRPPQNWRRLARFRSSEDAARRWATSSATWSAAARREPTGRAHGGSTGTACST